ncbi:MAG: hypothetical protein ACLFVJ_04380 [Persicimonas sp.]
MTRRLLCLLFAVLVVGSVQLGCSGSPDKPDEALTDDEARAPAFLEDIPSTSPYVFTSLRAFPMEILEPYLKTYGQIYDSMHKQLQQQYGGQSFMEQATSEEKFMYTLFGELRKASTMEGYEELGFSTRPQAAIYGIGWFPVMRITLGDAKALEATLQRIEAETGVEVRMRSLGEQSYREYTLEPNLKLAAAITDSELIVGLSPPEAFDDFVAYMLGEKKPARSMADVNVIEDIQAKYEFSAYGIGYADIKGIASVATGAAPGDEITRGMLDAVGYQAPQMEEQCRTELMSIFETVPRAVFGYTTLTAELMEMSAVLETEHPFARELEETAAPMPAYDSAMVEDSLVAVGLGIDVHKLSNFIGTQADRITRKPFQCPNFQQINDTAQQAKMMRSMLPPFVTQIRGAMAMVTGVDMAQQAMQPQSFDGLALVETADPLTLFNQLQQFVPQLQGASVQANGVPVALDGLSQLGWLKVPHVAMDDDTLAMSAGVGIQDDMAILLEDQKQAEAAENSPLLLIAYDYGELMSRFYDSMAGGGAYGQGQALGGSFEIMSKMFGTVVAEIDASDDGIILRYRARMFPDGGEGADASR